MLTAGKLPVVFELPRRDKQFFACYVNRCELDSESELAVVKARWTSALCLLVNCLASVGTMRVAAEMSEKPDAAFVVTVDGPKSRCEVERPSDGSGPRAMPCIDVAKYVHRVLKLPAGSFFDVRTITDVASAMVDDVVKSLRHAGFKWVPGPHAFFLTEPHDNDHNR